MSEIKDYVFYAILKGDQYNDGYSYGIQRGVSKRHESYFEGFVGMNPYIVPLECSSWNDAFEQISADGNVIIANAAVEIEDVKNRFYVVYLPTVPTPYQLKYLELISKELKGHGIDVGVYGEDRQEFKKLRIQNDFDCHKYLEEYIAKHKNNIISFPQFGKQKIKVN